MTLPPGTRIGDFEVQSALGAGGMGEVYRARDSKLRRDVAIKVLPGALAADADRTARFQREATILASLNHPNIAAIYGMEEAGGIQGLVLELVEGPTLAERIRSGPVPLAEALAIASSIADALEAAHDAGIVHRDLKPANVKVRTDGTVKVLDFGLAKALRGDAAAASADEPTTTQFETGRGLLLGTAAYMSPEQTRGDAVDRRSDVWAFGCVLYEMLTGRRSFVGDRTADIVAAVLREAPDWQQLPPETPVAIRRLLRRCLEKDPRLRLRDIADARLELREAAAAPGSERADETRLHDRPAWRRGGPWTTAAAGLIGLAAGAAIWNGLARPVVPDAPAVTRLSMTFPAYAFQPGLAQADFSNSIAVALSPDGSRVVYAGPADGRARSRLYLRPIAEFESRPLAGSDGASAPFFSPDGQSVAFFAGGKLKRIALADETVATICDTPEDTGGAGGTWGPDNTIVFATAELERTGLFRVAARGGTPDVLTTPDPSEEGGHGDPSFLPGGRALLFRTRRTRAGVDQTIKVLSMATTQQSELKRGLANRPRYVASGHLIYVENNTIMAAPFNLETMQIIGPPARIVERVDLFNFDVSSTGRLVYHPANSAGGRLAWVDRSGTVTPVALDEDRNIGRPRLSPDGRRVAMEVIRESRSDIAVYQFDNGTLSLLTTDGTSNSAWWHPDGRRIVYRKPGGLYWQAVDATTPELFLDARDPRLKGTSSLAPGAFSPDGSMYAFVVHGSGGTAADVWTMRMTGDRHVGPVVQRPGNQWGVRVSADGQWISYASDASGRFEIEVEPITGGGARQQVSSGGGREAVWAPDGRELFFRSGDRLMTAPLEHRPGSLTGAPRALFTGRFVSTDIPDYDVSRDGKQFLMLSPVQQGESQTLRVVDNWFEVLKRIAPAGR